MIHPTDWYGTILQSRDSLGRGLFTPSPTADTPNALFGTRAVISTQIPQGTLALVDWSRVLVALDELPDVQVLIEAYAPQDSVGIKVVTRADIGLAHPQAVLSLTAAGVAVTSPSPAPTVADLTALLYGASGTAVDSTQGAEVISTVTQLANAYTRGVGFTDGVPNSDIAAVILTAAARLLAHPRQLAVDETVGPDSASFRGGFTGWTVLEGIVLDRYRVRAV